MKKILSIILAILTVSSAMFATSVYASVAQTSITKITSTKDSIKIKWEPVDNADGYQIQKSTDKNFKKDSKKYTVSGSDSTSKSIKKLKYNKKYYVRIRTYKSKNKTKTYSKWSKTTSVKTKKNSSNSSSKDSSTTKTTTCTNNSNHSMPTGDIGKWFSSKNDLKNYVEAIMDEWEDKYENGQISWKEKCNNCPQGWECWNCAYCGKWTGNFKYDK